MELIRKYFPDLNDLQIQQFAKLDGLFREWNEKINVISRKDMDHLYEHHVLHSLAIAKHTFFESGMNILDLGTGGGFPGIPLAILFPEVKFTLLDSIAKKIRVVSEINNALKLRNVFPVCSRVESHEGQYDCVVSRAVSTLGQMVAWSRHLVPSQQWIMLKGGKSSEIRKEISPEFDVQFTPISDYFSESYFLEKYIVEVHKK